MLRAVIGLLFLILCCAIACKSGSQPASTKSDLILIQVAIEDVTDTAKPQIKLTMGGRCHSGQKALMNWGSPVEPDIQFHTMTAKILDPGQPGSLLATTVGLTIASKPGASPVSLMRGAETQNGRPFVVGMARLPVRGEERTFVVISSAMRETKEPTGQAK